MGHYSKNIVDDTFIEFPRAGFWLIHVVGSTALFLLGMRFAIRKAPMSILAYRMIRRLTGVNH